jgi:hypothetical protein
MNRNYLKVFTVFFLVIGVMVAHGFEIGKNPETEGSGEKEPLSSFDVQVRKNAQEMIQDGREIFRFDTFGGEAFWGDALQLHQAIATVSPNQALALGFKSQCACASPRSCCQNTKRSGQS